MTDTRIQSFISRWSTSGGAERANYALFLSELCDILEVPRPKPTRPEDDENDYVFERRVVFINPDGSRSFGRIDLYKRGCFVLETKQGIERQDEEALSTAGQQRRARPQAEQNVRAFCWLDPAHLSAKSRAILRRTLLLNGPTRQEYFQFEHLRLSFISHATCRSNSCL